MELAKTYYCHTIKINPNNMRALYGLLLVRDYNNDIWYEGRYSRNNVSDKYITINLIIEYI